jgi:putative sigma-54 modulation protein
VADVARARYVPMRSLHPFTGGIMNIPTEIMWHQLEPSEAVETSIQRWVTRLEHLYHRIISCKITVSQPNKRHRHGAEFCVNVVLDVPGGEIAASHVRHEDIYVAVADAFRATRRQLTDHIELSRGLVGREGRIGLNANKHRSM